MKFLVGLLFVSLAACDAMRPVGAYTPEAGKPVTDRTELPDADSGEPEVDDDEDDVGNDEDVTDDNVDGPDQPPDKPDASVPDPTGPFANLVDSYLMRIDQYSTASATEGSNTLTVHNRVSNLMFTKLSDDNGKLVSKEQLCFQTYAHECVAGCASSNGWTTTLDPGLDKIFGQKAAIERKYEVEDGVLIAPMAYMALGFDTDGAPSASTKLPTSKSDASLWKISDGKVALRTHLQAQLKSGVVQARLSCFVTTVQLQGMGFRVDDISGSEPLVKKDIPLDVTGSDLLTLSAEDDQSNLTVQKYCTVEQFQERAGDAAPKQANFVRFLRTNTANCPTSAADFEKRFPAPGPYAIQ